MRSIERKVYKKLKKEKFGIYDIEEIVDSVSKTELKKSYPDDCLFQSTKYFAKQIAKSLVKLGYFKREGSSFSKVKKAK